MLRGPFGTDGIDYFPQRTISRLHRKLPSPIVEEPATPPTEYDSRAPFGTDDQFFYPIKKPQSNKSSPHISVPSTSSTSRSDYSISSDFSHYKSIIPTSKYANISKESIDNSVNRIFSTMRDRIPSIENTQKLEKSLREEDIPYIQNEFDDIQHIISELRTSTIKAEMYQPQQNAKILNEKVSEWQLKIEPLLDPIKNETHKLSLKIKDTDKLSKEFAESNSVEIQRIGQEVLTIKNQVDKFITKAANAELRFQPITKVIAETNSRWKNTDQKIIKLFNDFVDNNKLAIIDAAKQLSSNIRNESVKRTEIFADLFREVSLLSKNSGSNFMQIRGNVVSLEKEMNDNISGLNKNIKETMQKAVDLQSINEETLHDSMDKLFSTISPIFDKTRNDITKRIKEIKEPMDSFTEETIPLIEDEKKHNTTTKADYMQKMNSFQENVDNELNSKIDPLAEFLANTQIYAENQINDMVQHFNEALPSIQQTTLIIDEAEDLITTVERSMSDLSVLVTSQLASMNQQLEQTRSEFFNSRQLLLSTLSQFSSTLNQIETSAIEEDYVLSQAAHNFEKSLFANLDSRLNAFESVIGVVKHNVSELLNEIEIQFRPPLLPEIPPMPSPMFEKLPPRSRIDPSVIAKKNDNTAIEAKADHTVENSNSNTHESVSNSEYSEASDFNSLTNSNNEITSQAESIAINAGLYSESCVSSQFAQTSRDSQSYSDYEYYYSDESEGLS